MARQKKQEKELPPDYLALVTFGDLMTLCLTFFVMLFTMSEIKKDKVSKVMRAMMMQLGVFPRHTSQIQIFQPSARITQTEAFVLRRGPPGRAMDVQTIREHDRARRVIGGKLLFEPESAELLPSGRVFLDQYIAPDIRGYHNLIELRGHTASLSRKDISARDLAYARAKAVADHLIENCGIDPRRFRIVSCGDNEPVENNATPAGREANRRVEIILTEDIVEERGAQPANK